MTPAAPTEGSRVSTYSVCILSAGRGIRLGTLTDDVNKSILPVAGQAVISHIIENFPHDVEIVVAVGYQADKVREYLAHAHDDRKVTCVDVGDWNGPGAGPGKSLLCCRPHLPGKFVVFAADTMVTEPVPPPDRNWIGVAPIFRLDSCLSMIRPVPALPGRDDTERFCTVQIDGDVVTRLVDKQRSDNRHAFIGAAGVRDYAQFWEALENDRSLVNNELQLSNGLAALIPLQLHPEKFTWHDTGTPESFQETRQALESPDTFAFDKVNEFTYQVNGRLVKYFGDPKIVSNRLARARALGDLCPTVRKASTWFYSYELVKGRTVYECLTPRLMNDFIEWAESFLWTPIDGINEDEYRTLCDRFYREKTLERVAMFYRKYPDDAGEPAVVNGERLPALLSLLDIVDWKRMAAGIPTNFHGDLQFDNVLRTGWLPAGRDAFKLIDWRQDFGGRTDVGDMRYDLAKLYGGLTIPYNLIKKNRFMYEEHEGHVTFDVETTLNLGESKNILERYIRRMGWKFSVSAERLLRDVELIRALIFLNMAPLHVYPFDRLLYYMGWGYLHRIIQDGCR